MQANPQSAKAHSVYLYQMHFNPSFDEAVISLEHRNWADRHLSKLPIMTRELPIDKDPDRKLRVGYVSGDFRQHVVGRFLLPILQCRDRNCFEVFRYSDTTAMDLITDELQKSSDGWRDTAGLDDDQLAKLICEDRVDILLDLTGHMAGSRLLAFARQPGPVQISHIGYPASSGIPQIQYRITDHALDPVLSKTSDEQRLYMPDSFYLYRPEAAAPVMATAPPVTENGYITFGSLNSPTKISSLAIELWSSVLKQNPGSKLLLAVLPDPSTRAWQVDQFQKNGIGGDRLILEPTRNFVDYMSLYHRIDVALDPQPYGGGITTCDALWMGAPVVSLVGKTSVGRIGASLLHAIGLPELLANATEDYVRIATELARDPARLNNYRHSLRHRLSASAIMNETRYTTHLENLYRQAWRAWVAA